MSWLRTPTGRGSLVPPLQDESGSDRARRTLSFPNEVRLSCVLLCCRFLCGRIGKGSCGSQPPNPTAGRPPPASPCVAAGPRAKRLGRPTRNLLLKAAPPRPRPPDRRPPASSRAPPVCITRRQRRTASSPSPKAKTPPKPRSNMAPRHPSVRRRAITNDAGAIAGWLRCVHGTGSREATGGAEERRPQVSMLRRWPPSRLTTRSPC